jgi:hypothetical protein
LVIIFIYLVAIGQQFPEGDHTFTILNRNNSQREQLWGQMALDLVQMPTIQSNMNVQMCQPAKWMGQFREKAAKTHGILKITEQMEFIKERGTTAEDGFQWVQLKIKCIVIVTIAVADLKISHNRNCVRVEISQTF